MEDIKWKKMRRGQGRRSPGDRRKGCVGYTGPERRSGKDRRLATGLAACVVAGSLLMGATKEATAEVHGRRLSDRLQTQEMVLSKQQYSLLNVPTAISKITPANIRAVPSVTDESPTRAAQKALKTHYSTIYYNDVDQLYSFSEVIEGQRRTVKAEEVTPPVVKKLQSMELTQEKVDSLVRRVSTILYLDPPKFHVSIYLYDTHKEVEEAYRELGHTGEVPKAFYSPKSKAVYLPVDGLTDTIFAHEIAHAIINAFYTPPLPHKLQEVLAHYVYNNLRDE